MLAPRLITCSQGVWRPSSSCLFVALLKEPSLLARDRRAISSAPKFPTHGAWRLSSHAKCKGSVSHTLDAAGVMP